MFASSNPPTFVLEANEKIRGTWDAIYESKKKGEDVTELKKIEKENGGIVGRFWENHAGCSCSHASGGCDRSH